MGRKATAKKGLAEVKKAMKAAPTADEAAANVVEQNKAATEYLNALLAGKKKPTNQYAGELLQQLRQSEMRLTHIKGRIEELQTELNQLTQQRIALIGVSQQLGMNIYRWRDKGEKDGTS